MDDRSRTSTRSSACRCGRADQPSQAGRHHDHLRHARPDRGDDARRPGRRDEQGVVQQVDTPERLYRQPAEHFVAGFIGSPAMNFLDGRLSPATPTGAAHVRTAGRARRAEPRSEARDVIVGVRPEDFLLGGRRVGAIPAEVEISERLGPEVLVHLRPPGLRSPKSARGPRRTTTEKAVPGSTARSWPASDPVLERHGDTVEPRTEPREDPTLRSTVRSLPACPRSRRVVRGTVFEGVTLRVGSEPAKDAGQIV